MKTYRITFEDICLKETEVEAENKQKAREKFIKEFNELEVDTIEADINTESIKVEEVD